MIGMDCVNQQARERDCKLTKRSQAERLAIADSLIASVWEEYLNGSVDRSTLQVAAYIQANANRIVWKLNELNNSNTPNTLKALDCISRQDAVDIINGYAEQFNGYIGTPNDSEVYAYARGLLLSIERNINALPSAQPERYTKEELRVFQHGISLSLLSKRSAQHWRYDEDTATEIKFLERLYEKVGADMRGEQDG